MINVYRQYCLIYYKCAMIMINPHAVRAISKEIGRLPHSVKSIQQTHFIAKSGGHDFPLYQSKLCEHFTTKLLFQGKRRLFYKTWYQLQSPRFDWLWFLLLLPFLLAITTVISMSSSSSSSSLFSEVGLLSEFPLMGLRTLWRATTPSQINTLVHTELEDISWLLLSLSSRDVIEHWLIGTLQMKTFLRIGFNWVHHQGTSLGPGGVTNRVALCATGSGFVLSCGSHSISCSTFSLRFEVTRNLELHLPKSFREK